jgi:hypothetical protein
MKPRVYIETTVVSYLTAWPSRDIVVAAHQQLTREWWQTQKDRFELLTSEVVLRESGAGDPQAARERMAVLATIPVLGINDLATDLADVLLRAGAVPSTVPEDALHIAIAVANGIDYLLTWNCRHLANATIRAQIDKVCTAAGHQPVVICTPEELWEEASNV